MLDEQTLIAHVLERADAFVRAEVDELASQIDDASTVHAAIAAVSAEVLQRREATSRESVSGARAAGEVLTAVLARISPTADVFKLTWEDVPEELRQEVRESNEKIREWAKTRYRIGGSRETGAGPE
jgi:hypothetical protein